MIPEVRRVFHFDNCPRQSTLHCKSCLFALAEEPAFARGSLYLTCNLCYMRKSLKS